MIKCIGDNFFDAFMGEVDNDLISTVKCFEKTIFMNVSVHMRFELIGVLV